MKTRIWLIAAVGVLGVAGGVHAWYGKGHQAMTTLAVRALPGELPGFFRQGAGEVAHVSVDPDLFRLKENPELRSEEVPEHYIDLELLEDGDPNRERPRLGTLTSLPADRYGLVQLCAKRNIDPAKVGFLPYAIVEWTQRLTIAFAEHRKWPADKAVQAKCLVYAGLLAHYAQDLCQPLHTTIHYDGKLVDGQKVGAGVHAKVDALLDGLAAPASGASRPATARMPASLPAMEAKAFEQLMPAVLAELNRSHALVDKVYELAKQFPEPNEPLDADSPAGQFAAQRAAAGASFTASLYLTAWRDSASFPLPEWHER